jgi:hypothetical protein
MPRIPWVRRVVVLLLIVAVAVPLAAAPIHRSDPVRLEGTGPLASLWTWLSQVWTKNGCAIDPGGRCLPGAVPAPPAGADNGCGIDPHGICHSTAIPLLQADNGCGIDPDGRCKG